MIFDTEEDIKDLKEIINKKIVDVFIGEDNYKNKCLFIKLSDGKLLRGSDGEYGTNTIKII